MGINGFVVGEWLGNGRAGSLYLARHETTGQVAVVRLVTVNKAIDTKHFLEEALMLMPEVPDLSVIEVTSMEGATVQFAMTPAPARAGGSSRRLVGFGALALFVAVAVFLILDWRRPAPPPTAVPVVTARATTVAPQPSNVVVQTAPAEAPSPVPLAPAVAPEPARAAVVKAEVPRPRPRPPPSRGPPPTAEPKAPACAYDDRFRGYARRTRLALQEMADPTLREFQAIDDRLTDAMVSKDCERANEALNDMRRFVGAPVE